MMFWIVATLLAVAVTATLLAPLLRCAGPESDDPTTAIYRDQLAEVDRDLARGILAPEEAERARTEIARRLLDANKNTSTKSSGGPSKAVNYLAILATCGLIIGSSLIYYGSNRILLSMGMSEESLQNLDETLTFRARIKGQEFVVSLLFSGLGAPGYPDVPRAQRIADSEAFRDTRMGQAAAEELAAITIQPMDESQLPPETRALLNRLRDIVPTRPDDLQGWELLAEHEARLRNFAAAARAQERVIAIKGTDATIADQTALADRMVSAAGGFVSPETESMLRTILEVEEGNIAARYYLGLLYFQTDRPDVAFRFWRDLAEQGSLENPHVRLAQAGVEDAAFRAGVEYSLPEATAPSLPDASAVADMSPEDRAAMIEGMVAGLADRLASQGGPVEEWARLINAYAVLGETDQAQAILREAMGVFGTSDAAAALLERVAVEAGLE